MQPQDIDIINKAILASIFCLGLVLGSALTVLITELKSKRNE